MNRPEYFSNIQDGFALKVIPYGFGAHILSCLVADVRNRQLEIQKNDLKILLGIKTANKA